MSSLTGKLFRCVFMIKLLFTTVVYDLNVCMVFPSKLNACVCVFQGVKAWCSGGAVF